jgi:hypothetical protein
MNRIIALTLATLAMAGCANEEALERLDARTDAALAQELRGRVQAGPSVSCVSQRNLRGNRSVGEGAIIFEGPGALVYVNRPPAGCPSLNSGRTLITRTTSSQLCAGDIVTVADLTSGSQYGSCGLGEFTPYRRVR